MIGIEVWCCGRWFGGFFEEGGGGVRWGLRLGMDVFGDARRYEVVYLWCCTFCRHCQVSQYFLVFSVTLPEMQSDMDNCDCLWLEACLDDPNRPYFHLITLCGLDVPQSSRGL